MNLDGVIEQQDLIDLRQALAIPLCIYLGLHIGNKTKGGYSGIIAAGALYAGGWQWDDEKLCWVKPE